MSDCLIINTGVSNTASIIAAFGRPGMLARSTARPDAVASAPLVVLPGVGSFKPAIDKLRDEGLDQALRDRIDADRPTLAICLGMQLLLDGSDEAVGAAGLGVIPGVARAFPPGARRPQMGWSPVEPDNGCALERGAAYFANSFALVDEPGSDWRCAWSRYAGTRYISAISRGGVLACQFHPELSGAWGDALIARWAGAAAQLETAASCS